MNVIVVLRDSSIYPKPFEVWDSAGECLGHFESNAAAQGFIQGWKQGQAEKMRKIDIDRQGART